ncbi:MAG: hypothetical protein QM679_04730 [Patulibacter sp.]
METAMLRVSRKVQAHWLGTAGLMFGVALLGGAAVGLLLDGWNSVSVYETCVGTVLAICIFVWTLSGLALRIAEEPGTGARNFVEALGKENAFVPAQLDEQQLEHLAIALGVERRDVRDELAFWLRVGTDGRQGGRPAYVVTRRFRYLKVTSNRGWRVVDLATGENLLGD